MNFYNYYVNSSNIENLLPYLEERKKNEKREISKNRLSNIEVSNFLPNFSFNWEIILIFGLSFVVELSVINKLRYRISLS